MLVAKGILRPMTNPANKFPVLPNLSRRRCLTAVASRDARLDSAFVYAVRSTGIYCRPSCPSRRPRPKQMQFFAMPEAAERAGFRPCLRCRPQLAPRNTQAELVRRVCSAIEADVERPADLRRLAEGSGMSAQHLQRTFRKAMGITPRQYADAIRVARLKSHLRKGTDVTTALYETEYGSGSRIYEKSDAQLGITPPTYSRGGRSLGRPSATRAVARACATNPTSIVVPCHRVIRTDGSLGGYRWGLHRKQRLLEQELHVAKSGGDSAKRDKAVAATR